METTLGKSHSVSPFTGLYAKHGMAAAAQVAPKAAAPAKKQQKQAAAASEDAKPAAKKQAAAEPAAAGGKGKKGKGGGGGKAQPQAAAASAGPELTEELKTFSQCDIRVGKIVECEPHPESEKLFIEKIDLGEPNNRIRTIVSGLQPYVTLEEMLADKIIVFANMKPRKLAGIMSEGMVLCASNADHTQVELMRPSNDSAVGERVSLEGNPFGEAGLTQDSQPILNPKKKVEPKLLEKLTTNARKEGLFNGVKMTTVAGPILAKTLANGTIS